MNEPVRESRVGVARARTEIDANADPFLDELPLGADATGAGGTDAEPWRAGDMPFDFAEYVAARWQLPPAEAFALLCGWVDSYVPRREYEIRLLSSKAASTNKAADQ